MTSRHVGLPHKRPDDPRLLTGRGKYVDDLAPPRMVHVAFLRSPHAHARIARLDLDTARSAPAMVAKIHVARALRCIPASCCPTTMATVARVGLSQKIQPQRGQRCRRRHSWRTTCSLAPPAMQ